MVLCALSKKKASRKASVQAFAAVPAHLESLDPRMHQAPGSRSQRHDR